MPARKPKSKELSYFDLWWLVFTLTLFMPFIYLFNKPLYRDIKIMIEG